MSWAAIAIGGGGALISGIAGNIGKKKRANRAVDQTSDLADKYMTSLNDYTSDERSAVNDSIGDIRGLYDVFDNESNRSYLDTTEGKSFSSMIDERSKKNKDALTSRLNMMGGSTESFLAGLGQINEQEGASTRDLVSGADQRRSQLRGAQSGLLSQILGANQGLLSNKTNQANSAMNFATGVYNQSQSRNDAQMNNVNSAFQNAAMLAFNSK